ncbi:MFS transporter [Aspergillus thermomutatus]|uniref:Major facilitator superfamily (MFS) profile domain-containing protein n=1 Tax=Aspergillus thermomutatus TaxID=41047 RepID=A0A397GWL7_ASPTH|nr:uncharacterized protein CDV56_100306 [Aspergillus thermomutatus]RHZ53904.1 hypothetical protein CDV56_100306 [Aspergillus thermomutatus]
MVTSSRPLTDLAEAEDLDLVDFDGPHDPRRPVNWAPARKWTIVTLLSIMSFITPLASSMFAPGVPECLAEFGSTSATLMSFVVSIYLLGYAAGPLVIAPLSELYGRSIMYHFTNVLFVIFTIACAVSTNLGMLIGFRFLEGIAGSAVLTIGGGTVADLFIPQERGKVLAAWTMGPLLGPVLGPVMGSFLSAAKGWRWVFWLLTIVSGAMACIFLLLLRETSSVVILRNITKRRRKETGNPALRSRLDADLSARLSFQRAIVRPLKLLLLSPIVALMATLAAIVYGYLYLLFTTFTPVFEDTYNFSSNIVGLTYLGLGVGMMIGLFGFGALSDRIIKSKAAKHDGVMKPEYRLPPMIVGGIAIPVGLFIYGWTADKHVFWFVPILGTAFVGFGFIAYFVSSLPLPPRQTKKEKKLIESIQMPIQAYLVDAFTIHAASALGAGAVWRSIVGALLPLAGLPMYNKLGLGWGNSLLGFLAVAMLPIPFVLLKYGEHIRTSLRWQVRL